MKMELSKYVRELSFVGLLVILFLIALLRRTSEKTGNVLSSIMSSASTTMSSGSNPSQFGYDIIMLGGQSNMQGINPHATVDQGAHSPDEMSASMRDVYGNPVHIVSIRSPNTIYDLTAPIFKGPVTVSDSVRDVSPGWEFVKKYAQNTTTLARGRRVIVVPWAISGQTIEYFSRFTDSSSQWSKMVNSLSHIKRTPGHHRVVAWLYLQGESDATRADDWLRRLRILVDTSRSTFNTMELADSGSSTPVIVCNIMPSAAVVLLPSAGGRNINSAMYEFSDSNSRIVSSLGLRATVYRENGVGDDEESHFSARDSRLMGLRCFAAFMDLVHPTVSITDLDVRRQDPAGMSVPETLRYDAALGILKWVLTSVSWRAEANPMAYQVQVNTVAGGVTRTTNLLYTEYKARRNTITYECILPFQENRNAYITRGQAINIDGNNALIYVFPLNVSHPMGSRSAILQTFANATANFHADLRQLNILPTQSITTIKMRPLRWNPVESNVSLRRLTYGWKWVNSSS